jgi:hypothetical protein
MSAVPAEGRCQLHQRVARTTCKRCGGFICDWCEKLAPSWGPGYCNDCLHFVSPDESGLRRMSFGVMFVIALVAVFAFVSFVGTRAALAKTPLDLGGVIWSGTMGVGFLVADGLIIAQYWRKKRRARD